MSPRESQRLLSLLNISFKQQLDREHTTASSSNEHHAANHLQSILTNPLFDAKPRTRANSGSKSQKNGKLLEQLQNHTQRPVDAFKDRVSQGMADLKSAKYFLNLQYKECLASPAATPRVAMQSSGAASTILQWLWASGMEDAGEFLKDRAFISLLVPFIVAEGQHSRALRWLHRCHSPDETPYSSLRGSDIERNKAFLLRRLINEETRFGDGLDSAINLFVRIVADLRNARLTKSSQYFIAKHAAWTLTKIICRLPQAALPKASIVRPFLETMKLFHYDPLLNATLCVYLQEPPYPQAALTYFQNASCMTSLETNSVRHSHTILLGLRAAELFLKDGRQTEALWIMGFLRTNFAKELFGLSDPIRKDPVLNEPGTLSREEDRSLHLLDTLAVQ